MIRTIGITPALNGFIVVVGCQTLTFNTREELLRELRGYLENPEETEKRYVETGLNAKHTLDRVPAPPLGNECGATDCCDPRAAIGRPERDELRRR